MAHEHETPAGGGGTAVTAAAEPTREPDYIARARRILGGDVRPGDYLATTPEVEADVAFGLACTRDHVRKAFEAGRIPAVFELDPCVETEQRTTRLLSAYHAGELVVSTTDDTGTIVLATGVENCAALMNAFPYDVTKTLDYRAPDPPEGVWP